MLLLACSLDVYTVNHFQLLLYIPIYSTNYALYCAQTCLLCSNSTHYSRRSKPTCSNNYITLWCKTSKLQHQSQTRPGHPLGDLPSYLTWRLYHWALGPGHGDEWLLPCLRLGLHGNTDRNRTQSEDKTTNLLQRYCSTDHCYSNVANNFWYLLFPNYASIISTTLVVTATAL